MKTIKDITFDDGKTIFIEMEYLESDPVQFTSDEDKNDLPPGAELTSTAEKVVHTMDMLKTTMTKIFTTVHEGLNANYPDEWGIELNIGFKGKVNPIPVIVSSESEVALKIHATWKKSTP